MTSSDQQIPDIPQAENSLENPAPVKREDSLSESPDDVSHLVTLNQMVPDSELTEPSSLQINPELVKRSDALFGIQQPQQSTPSSEPFPPLSFSPQPIQKTPVSEIAFEDLSLTASGMALSPGESGQQHQQAVGSFPDLLPTVKLPRMDPVFHFQQTESQPCTPLASSLRSSSSQLNLSSLSVDLPPITLSTNSGSQPSSPVSEGPKEPISANPNRLSLNVENLTRPNRSGSDKPGEVPPLPTMSPTPHGHLYVSAPPEKPRWTAATRRPSAMPNIDTVLMSLESSKASGIQSPNSAGHHHGLSVGDGSTGTSPQGLGSSSRMKPIITGRHRQFILDNDGSVKYATLEMLVKIFTTEQFVDSKLVQPFIVTADLHTPPNKLLDALIARYNVKEPEGLSEADLAEFRKNTKSVRLRVIIFVQTWINLLVNENTPKDLIERLNAFIKEVELDFPGPASRVMKLLQKKVEGKEAKVDFQFNDAAPTALLPMSLQMGDVDKLENILDLNAKELARQMTLLEQELFRMIRPWELQNLAFTKKDKSLAPNIFRITQRFNAVSRWITKELVSVSDLKERIKLFQYFIDVADYCVFYQNYNALNEIVCAMNATPAYRLRKTWGGLPKKYKAKFDELSKLVGNEKNYQCLRQRIHSIQPPCVPFLGIYLTDLTFLEEGNPTMLGDLINWQKCRRQATLIMEVQTYQQAPYCLESVPHIREFLLNLPTPGPKDEDILYELSLKAEPKETAASPAPAPASAGVSSPLPALPGMGQPSGGVFGELSSMNARSDALDQNLLILLPGSTEYAEIPTKNQRMTMTQAKKCAFDIAVERQLVRDDEECEKFMLVAPTTRSFVGGNLSESMEVSELETFRNQGAEIFALYRSIQVLDVVWVGEDSSYAINATLDLDSPLYSAIRVLDNIFKRNERFFLMMANGNSLYWLDMNLPLNKQGFEIGCRLIAQPLMRILSQPDSDDMAKTRADRLAMEESCKIGFLSKVKLKNVCHYGVLPRTYTRLVANNTSAPGNGLSSSTRGAPDNKNGEGTIPQSSSPSPSPVVAAAPIKVSTGTMLLSLSQNAGKDPASLGQIRTSSDQRWFLLQDNFLCYYTENFSPTMRYCWPLDYCTINLVTLTNGTMAVTIQSHDKYPFQKLRPKTSVFYGQNDFLTRDWYCSIRARTRRNKKTAFFGTPLGELARRPDSKSVIPEFVRIAFNRGYTSVLSKKNLFSEVQNFNNMGVVRSLIDSGKINEAVALANDTALVQLAVSYYGELSESLLNNKALEACIEYATQYTDPKSSNKDSISAIVAAMDPDKAVNLKYLLSFLTMWASETSVPAMGAAFLAQLVVRTENQSTLLIFQSIVTKVFTDLQRFIQEIPFPKDQEALDWVRAQPAATESETLSIPVTLLSVASIQRMMKLLASSKGIDNLAPSADYGPGGQSSPPNQDIHHYDVFHRLDTGDLPWSNILRRRKQTTEFTNTPPKMHVRTASSSGSDFSDADIVDLNDDYDDDSPRIDSPDSSHSFNVENSEDADEKSSGEAEGDKKGVSGKMRRGLTRLRCSLRLTKGHHSQQNLSVKSVLCSSPSSSQLATSNPPVQDQPTVKATAPIPVPQPASESPLSLLSQGADSAASNAPDGSSDNNMPFGSV